MPAEPTLLDYRTPRRSSLNTRLVRVARQCALVPCVLGIVVFIAGIVARAEVFALFGFLTILLGCVLSFVGAICAMVYRYQAHFAEPEIAVAAKRDACRAAVMLFLNFPLALLFSVVGYWMLYHVAIHVTNEDDIVIEQIVLHLPQGPLELGPIIPGQTLTAYPKALPEGEMNYRVTVGAESSERTIRGFAVDDPSNFEDCLDLGVKNGMLLDRTQ